MEAGAGTAADRFWANDLLTPSSGAADYGISDGFQPQPVEDFLVAQDFISTSDQAAHQGTLNELWQRARREIYILTDPNHVVRGAPKVIDKACARTLHAYTVECALYKKLNEVMRDGNQQEVRSGDFRPYLHFIYHLDRALSLALPLPYATDQRLFRGMGRKLDTYAPPLDFPYRKGQKVTWHAFSSTSKSLDVALTFTRQNSNPYYGTVFIITNPKSAKGISSWSEYPDEDEWLYRYNTHFLVLETTRDSPNADLVDFGVPATVDTSDLDIIVLKEV